MEDRSVVFLQMAVILNATTLSMQGNEDEEDDSYVPYDQRPETYIVPVVFLLILVVGVIGNGILVFTLVCHASMRNVPNTYVLSLALGDLLVRKTKTFFEINETKRDILTLVKRWRKKFVGKMFASLGRINTYYCIHKICTFKDSLYKSVYPMNDRID